MEDFDKADNIEEKDDFVEETQQSTPPVDMTKAFATRLKEEKAKWVMYDSRSTYVTNNVAGVTCDDLNTLNRFSKFLSARQKYLDEKYGYKPVCTSLEVYGETLAIPETGAVSINNGNIQFMRVVGYPENCDMSGLTITSSYLMSFGP